MHSGEVPKIVVEDADLKLHLEQEELYFTKNELEVEVCDEPHAAFQALHKKISPWKASLRKKFSAKFRKPGHGRPDCDIPEAII